MTENAAGEAAEALLLQIVDAVAAELRPGRAPRPATLQSGLDHDLGYDSLGRVELTSRLDDAFDVSLPERVAIEAETPADLLAAIRMAPARATPGPPRRARPTNRRPAPSGDMTVPADAVTWAEVLDFHDAERPEAVAIRFHSDDGHEPVLTFSDLVAEAEAIAGGLRALGVEPGAAVSLMLPSGPDYFRCFAGIWLAGAVPVPIYPPFRPSHIEEHVHRQTGILANCEAVCLITTDELARVAGLLREQVPSLNAVVTTDALKGERAPRPAVTSEQTALLQYTSGSTAAPKGVVLSHANLLANVRAIGDGVAVRPDDVTVSWLPLYHDMGLIGAWLGSLYHGVPLVLMSPLAFIGRPVRWLEAIHRHRGTITAAPNFAFDLCTRRIRDEDLAGLDLSSLRAVYNGAEPVSVETMQRFTERFAPHGFRPEAMMPVYGLAEASVALTFPPLGRRPLIDTIDRRRLAVSGEARPVPLDTEGARRLVACGRPLPGHEVRIVDEADRELSDRHEGHIQFRGPSTTKGYLHNPEANARLLHGDWLDSGDLGYIAQSDLYVTGRVKDIIIKAGRNIYPEELEAAVGAIDGVRAGCVAVFGIQGATQDSSGGEQLVVMAESRKTGEADRERLSRSIEALALDLTGMPADQVVLAPPNTVLKTSSGKIRRDACRQLFERGAVGEKRRPVWQQVVALKLASIGPRLARWRRRAGASLFAIWGWLLVAVLAPLGWLCVLVLPGIESRWAVSGVILRLLARLSGTPLEVRGLEHLPDGPAVLVANHASYLDGFALVAALPRPVSFVAKSELGEHWVVGAILRRLGAVLVERFDTARSIADATSLGEQAAATDRPLLFFPEGTFDRMPGLLPFHMGAFLIAARHRLPLVPVAIKGTRSMLRSEVWFPRPGRIEVSVGEPIAPSAEQDDWASAMALRDTARRFIEAGSGEASLDR